jgi:hypothetical protein
MDEEVKRYHSYFAEASAFEGSLELPFVQRFCAPTFSKLKQEGGYVSQHADNFRLGGVISFKSAYTQVAGNRDTKPDHGWNTLATAVIEGFNVLDVVTADRIVAQMSTDHPPIGYVPTVTFLGTRFENLRIAGHPVNLDIDTNILGSKPAQDAPYTSDPGFLERVTRQYERIRGHQNLPDEIGKHYNQLPSSKVNRESIECSLVNQAEGSYPGHSFGHVIDVPNFGRISLGVLRLEQSEFNDKGIPMKTTIRLTMVKMNWGCPISGSGGGGSLINNGGTKP